MSNLLGFKIHEGDKVRLVKDGRRGVVVKSYCNMSGWCDEFRAVVRFYNPACGERDLSADELEVEEA